MMAAMMTVAIVSMIITLLIIRASAIVISAMIHVRTTGGETERCHEGCHQEQCKCLDSRRVLFHHLNVLMLEIRH